MEKVNLERSISIFFCTELSKTLLTLQALTPQNGQTHSNNLSAICRQIVWVCLTILRGWLLKGSISTIQLFLLFLKTARAYILKKNLMNPFKELNLTRSLRDDSDQPFTSSNSAIYQENHFLICYCYGIVCKCCSR